MKKITENITTAFQNRQAKKQGNTKTDGKTLWLYNNEIANYNEKNELEICDGGFQSVTTKERLNGLKGVKVHQKNFQWFLNGKIWNGDWVVVKDFK